jgi:tRNA A-37 threonylcarbamoyl transferase component Bud32
MGDGDRPEPGDGDLLRQWEDKIASAGDPLSALADLLAHGSKRRTTLFQRLGERVLGCELRSILGAGGMGVTYAGVAADGAPVAIKLVLGVGGTAAARFEQECRLLQSFDHPAIVRYRDHAVLDDGTGVLVMDRIDGVDLEHLLQDVLRDDPPATVAGQALLHEVDGGLATRLQSPRYQRRILRLCATVADGLDAAHRRGVVHRDVKPANVLVRDDLSPALIDFGLARDQQIKVSFTASGAAMGTLAYMAPEQLGRDPGAVDPRTDVYALGLVLFRARLGRDARADVRDVVAAAQQPFLLDARQSRTLPVDLQAILYRCLDPRSERRYPTMQALAQDLRAAAGAGAVQARRPSAVRRFFRDRQRLRSCVLLVVAVALVGAVWSWPRGREVVFAANVEAIDASLTLDGGQAVALGDPVELPYGRHVVRLDGPKLQAREVAFEVVPGLGRQWVALSTRYEARAGIEFRQPGRTIVQFTSGQSFVPAVPGMSLDERWVDGVLVRDRSPHAMEAVVPPGIHVFRARDSRGREEEQRVRISDAPADVLLLPGCVAAIDGSFRRTLSTVHSPRPDDLIIEGAAQAWLGAAKQSDVIAGGTMMAPCALVPATPEQWCEASLRCELPQPMRSAVAYLRARVSSGGQMEIWAGFEGEPLASWPQRDDGSIEPLQEFRSTAGSRAFVVRARMRAATAATSVLALARFLEGGLYGGHWRAEPPCFALVADPGIDVARLPAKADDVVAAAPRLAVRSVVELEGARSVAALAWRRRNGDRLELLIGRPSDHGATGVVEIRDWPSMAKAGEIEAGALHPRVHPLDGRDFGSFVCVVDDRAGDGAADLVVGDVSSGLLGQPGIGSVGRLGTAGGPPAWTWPRGRSVAAFQDDSAGDVFAAGDWNGDGLADLAVGAGHAWTPDGRAKSGLVAVVDARTGAELWRRYGERSHGSTTLRGSHGVSGGGPATLMLVSTIRVPDEDLDLGRSVALWIGGKDGQAIALPDLPQDSAFVLGGADSGPAPSVIVLRVGSWHDGFEGLERHALVDGSMRLVTRMPLELPRSSKYLRITGRHTGPLPDVDGDGFTDAVFGVVGDVQTRVLVVSGRDLRLLGVAELTPAIGPIDSSYMPLAVLGADGRPDEILFVGNVGDRRYTARLVAVKLPR